MHKKKVVRITTVPVSLKVINKSFYGYNYKNLN